MLQHFTRARIRATVATLLIVGSALVGTPAFATPALATAQAADAPIATASISGIVTGPDSAGRLVGLANISVSASSTNWMLTRYAVTDSTGAFTISGLSAASFTLDFRTDNSTGSYVEQWSGNKPSQLTATYFDVAAGQVITGDNVVVAAGAAISGTVTGVDPATAQSVALANVNVGVYGQDGSPLAFAATSNTGLFTIKGLAAGKYTLSFQAWSQSGTYLPQWWSNKATQATATRFAVTAGQVLTNYN